jgi:hypothetical protein
LQPGYGEAPPAEMVAPLVSGEIRPALLEAVSIVA